MSWKPNFDIDLAEGKKCERWVEDLLRSEPGKVEVKGPKFFLNGDAQKRFFVEYAQKPRGCSEYIPSGILTTEAKIWFFTFGDLPGGVFVETEWLYRATAHAYQNPSNHQDGGLRGDNPTHGVLVSLHDLWLTRDAPRQAAE